MVLAMGVPKSWSTGIYICSAAGIVVFEEIYFILQTYFNVRAVKKILFPVTEYSMWLKTKNVFLKMIIGSMPVDCPGDQTELPAYDTLSKSDQVIYQRYYDNVFWQNKGRLVFMARESSIQLVYQNAIVIYDYVYPPVHEMDYTSSLTTPRALWITGITIQLLSEVTSASTTFSTTIESLKLKYFIKGQRPSFQHCFIKVFQVLAHTGIATTVVYMPRGH